ncbi:hypothetical protein SRS16CHR_04584 [Variovorax sp. SRS16]|uniref:hypothetical protein n=1 Tax=Variovorax sp. SRS16 TaxID=282217 RepID=UPI001315B212|nr:hypothetical protein [Variovorax sp. SRS16]VTU29995.1 hypothetical protein SRS16CHR_04584 [Variovorax sp. SRS16]
MSENDRALCAAAASLLRASAVMAACGLGLSCVSLLVLALTARSLPAISCMGFGATIVIGVFERYLAARLRFDGGLLESLATGTITSMPALDSATHRLGLRFASDASRTLEERVQDARQLIQRHSIVIACQGAMFLLALLTQDL